MYEELEQRKEKKSCQELQHTQNIEDVVEHPPAEPQSAVSNSLSKHDFRTSDGLNELLLQSVQRSPAPTDGFFTVLWMAKEEGERGEVVVAQSVPFVSRTFL